MSDPKLDVHVKLKGFSRIDFDRSKIRKALRKEGRGVRKEARRLVARRAISGAGQYPGRQSGALQRSIRVKVSRPGFLVVIRPYKTAEMGKDFYPAFLHYGVRRRRIASLAKRHRKQPAGPYRLAPRDNYMIDALESRKSTARTALKSALQDALIPRK